MGYLSVYFGLPWPCINHTKVVKVGNIAYHFQMITWLACIVFHTIHPKSMKFMYLANGVIQQFSSFNLFISISWFIYSYNFEKFITVCIYSIKVIKLTTNMTNQTGVDSTNHICLELNHVISLEICNIMH